MNNIEHITEKHPMVWLPVSLTRYVLQVFHETDELPAEVLQHYDIEPICTLPELLKSRDAIHYQEKLEELEIYLDDPSELMSCFDAYRLTEVITIWREKLRQLTNEGGDGYFLTALIWTLIVFIDKSQPDFILNLD